MTQVAYSKQAICHHGHTWECKCAGCRGDNCWNSQAFYGKVGDYGPYYDLGLTENQRDNLVLALTQNLSLNTGDWYMEILHKLRKERTS